MPPPRRTTALLFVFFLLATALAVWSSWPPPVPAAAASALSAADRVVEPAPRHPRRPTAPHIRGDAPPAFLQPAPAIAANTPGPSDTGAAADTGPEEVPRITLLRAHIRNADGTPVTRGLLNSPDCELWGWTDDNGVAEVMVVEAEACLVQGRRPDGLLWGRSEWLEVEMDPGNTVEVELVIPMERTGGLGVMIRAHDEGMVVERVWPRSPAAEMGLAAGDIITEVDGLPTATLTVDEFVEVMTGPEGSDVAFAIAYEGDTGWIEEPLTLTRQRIEDP